MLVQAPGFGTIEIFCFLKSLSGVMKTFSEPDPIGTDVFLPPPEADHAATRSASPPPTAAAGTVPSLLER